MAELWMIKIYAATRYRFENPAISPDLERASVAKKRTTAHKYSVLICMKQIRNTICGGS